jgi:hypothetical protein
VDGEVKCGDRSAESAAGDDDADQGPWTSWRSRSRSAVHTPFQNRSRAPDQTPVNYLHRSRLLYHPNNASTHYPAAPSFPFPCSLDRVLVVA